jgi:signal transduction histidine kinase
VRELGRRLNTVPDKELLASLADTVASSLRLPYVAIEGADGGPLAACGTPGETVERWPMSAEQGPAGFLVAAPRRGEDAFDERDRELLGDIAGQIGVAVYAVGLTAELLRSRQHLVTAREEERRRLRRDLHDGLGPVLTAVGLTLDAARTTVRSNPPTAERHIVEAKEATAQALTDLRRLVHGLRPPVLDDLGLVPALRAQADRLAAGSVLTVTIDAGEIPDLPAAVEVAAFRIAVEAVTNARRHSDASACHVRLAASDGALTICVRDNGNTAAPWAPGVGLTAMRERAEELGGTMRAGPEPAGGASVNARLPLPSASVAS